MKDADAAFEESLQDLINLAGKSNLRGCFVTATNMTRLSTMLCFKRGIFIAEVLEGVFSQIFPLFNNYVVSPDEKKGLIDNMTQNLRALMSDYKGDKARLYDILEDLRATATVFQLKCISTAFPKDDDAPERS